MFVKKWKVIFVWLSEELTKTNVLLSDNLYINTCMYVYIFIYLYVYFSISLVFSGHCDTVGHGEKKRTEIERGPGSKKQGVIYQFGDMGKAVSKYVSKSRGYW